MSEVSIVLTCRDLRYRDVSISCHWYQLVISQIRLHIIEFITLSFKSAWNLPMDEIQVCILDGLYPLPWTHLTISLSLCLGFPTVIVASCHVTWQSCPSDIMSSLLGRGNQNSNMKLNLYSNGTRYLLIIFGINMLHSLCYETSRFLGMIRTESNIITPIFPHPSIWNLRLPSGFLLVPVLHPPQVVANGLASAAPPNAAKCVGLIGVNIPKSQVRGRS